MLTRVGGKRALQDRCTVLVPSVPAEKPRVDYPTISIDLALISKYAVIIRIHRLG